MLLLVVIYNQKATQSKSQKEKTKNRKTETDKKKKKKYLLLNAFKETVYELIHTQLCTHKRNHFDHLDPYHEYTCIYEYT